jgi:hypothetical protein
VTVVSELTDAEAAQDFWSEPEAAALELPGPYVTTSRLLNAAMVGPDRGLPVSARRRRG